MILLIDNNDSFTYNVVEQLRRVSQCEFAIKKSKDIQLEFVDRFDHIIFSPGPGVPADFPIMSEVLERYDTQKSILGICLGHQAICQHYGARLKNMEQVVHGISSTLNCDPQSVLMHTVSSMVVGRYHSWIVESAPDVLKVTATDQTGSVMAVEHTEKRVYGIQFHPESYITQGGDIILRNFLNEIS